MSTIVPRRASRFISAQKLWRTQQIRISSSTIASVHQRQFYSTQGTHYTKPKNPDPRENPALDIKPPQDINVGRKRFAEFDLAGKIFVVTGGAQGLGLALAEGLVEAGGKVYCLDRADKPDEGWHEAQRRVVPEWGGELLYRKQDVKDVEGLDKLMTEIADENQGIDGVIAAAGVQQITPAVEYKPTDVADMLAINYTGVMMTATAAARQMIKYKKRGSICMVASVSGLEATKGLISPVYNSSKAAVTQLARNLAMEWSPIKKDGTGGIRVNCLSPGHIITPMVRKNLEEVPGLQEDWESATMMGRLAETQEFKGAALFLLSNASSYVTGSNLIVDGGHSAW
ncbi:Fc.00g080230.m01.CDS01 [Cosmosporella sp. VM-42]